MCHIASAPIRAHFPLYCSQIREDYIHDPPLLASNNGNQLLSYKRAISCTKRLPPRIRCPLRTEFRGRAFPRPIPRVTAISMGFFDSGGDGVEEGRLDTIPDFNSAGSDIVYRWRLLSILCGPSIVNGRGLLIGSRFHVITQAQHLESEILYNGSTQLWARLTYSVSSTLEYGN